MSGQGSKYELGAGHDDSASPDSHNLSAELDTIDNLERYPVTDPGVEEHIPRLTDVDEKAANRATRQVATMFGLVPLLAIAFVVIYFAVPREATLNAGFVDVNALHLGLGLTLGLAILLIGIASVQWARQIMTDVEMTDVRHEATSSPDDRAAILKDLETGVDESKIKRRKVLGYSLVGALGALALPVIAVFADLGPKPTAKLRAATIEHTIWAEGIRLVNDITYLPIKASSLEIGQLVNGEPENLKALEGVEFNQEGEGGDHRRTHGPELHQDPAVAQGLGGRRHPLLFQDLHPRRLPDQPVGTADPSPALPLSPVDVRSG